MPNCAAKGVLPFNNFFLQIRTGSIAECCDEGIPIGYTKVLKSKIATEAKTEIKA